jgi:DNA/RNA endonuclease YhcR with UshA esterase domain
MKKTLLTFVAIFACFAMFAQTVYQIQYTTDPSGNSPYATQIVTTHGTVVGIYSSSAGVRGGFYLQGGAGAWNGVYVYAGTTGAGTSTTCSLGDSVSVTGTVSEYNGLTEIGTITACTTIASGKSYVINDITTNDANTEKWESCIVRVKNADCTGSPSAGTFTVTDGSGSLSVFKQLYQALALTTGTYYYVTGIMTWFNTGSIYELYPRTAADFTVSTGFSTPKADLLSLSRIGRTLTVNNAENGSTVDIYSSLGAKVQSAKLQGSAIQLNELANGLYIVRVGNLTSKIML